VRELAAELGVQTVLPCDVTSDAEMDALGDGVAQAFGRLDCLVHAVAFAKREELTGMYLDTSKEGYQVAQEVSAYSLPAVSRRLVPLMEGREGSIITLTYLGSERVIPNYNVMGVAKAALEASVRYLAHDLGPRGIRVNAISSGPIRTLSASGIEGFATILDQIAQRAPLRRNITADEVGDVCAFLAGPLSRGITGSTIFVDAGTTSWASDARGALGVGAGSGEPGAGLGAVTGTVPVPGAAPVVRPGSDWRRDANTSQRNS
jgi:enoyl-[acyl-carrier protein] reductase I